MATFLLLVLFATIGAVAQSVPKQDLFINGEKYDITYPCYRQPAIIPGARNPALLLAFAEGRNISLADCSPPLGSNEVGGLVYRRSVNSGQTWTSPQTMYSGNIDFYTVVGDNTTGVIWLMLQQGSAVLVFTSSDDGISWSSPKPLKASPPPAPYHLVSPAVGHGIQLKSELCPGPHGCSDAGRLVMPFVCSNTSKSARDEKDSGVCPTCYSCLLLSDDHGASWRVGAPAQSGSRESQAAQIAASSPFGELYVSERNMGPHPGHRMFSRSHDGGQTLGEAGVDPSLPTPCTPHWTGIVAGLLALPGAPGHLLFTAPSSPTVRSNLTARVSHDGGASWPGARVVWPGLAGYSDLAVTTDGVAIIFENGDHTFADRISVSILPLDWLPQ